MKSFKTMDNFFQNLGKSKIPTLTLLGIMYYFGADMLRGSVQFVSPTGIAGSAVLLVAGVLTLISFLDYRHREQTDNAISQLDNAITSLGKAVTSAGKTTLLAEKSTQETLRAGSGQTTIGKRRQYTVTDEAETETT